MLELVCPRPLDALELLGGQSWVREHSLFGTRIHLVVDAAEAGRDRAVELLAEADNRPTSAEAIVPSLEDVFIHQLTAASRETR